MRASRLVMLGVATAASVTGCDWVQTQSGSTPGKTTYSVTINHEEFERDRADFKRRAQEQISRLDDQLRVLNERAKAAAGDAKQQLDAEVIRQQANLEQARGELKEIDAATAEKWAEVKARSAAAFEDLKQGLDNALSRFKSTP